MLGLTPEFQMICPRRARVGFWMASPCPSSPSSPSWGPWVLASWDPTQTLHNDHAAHGLIITKQSITKQAIVINRNTPTCPNTWKNHVCWTVMFVRDSSVRQQFTLNVPYIEASSFRRALLLWILAYASQDSWYHIFIVRMAVIGHRVTPQQLRPQGRAHTTH